MPSPSTPSPLQKNHPFRQWKSWQIPGTQLEITGYSRSNDKTFFHLPGLRCCLDAGLCEGRQPDVVFLTHTHHDHSADLEFLASKDGVRVYVPEAAREYVEVYLRAKRELNHVSAFDPALAGSMELCGVKQGDRLELGKQSQYQVRVFSCIHKVPCVGYAFSERKKRLTEAFAQLREELVAAGRASEFGRRMAEARKQGQAVDEEVFEPRFAFLGDTHPRVFEENPWLFAYPVVFSECTYLDDGERERAERNGHTLWSELRPYVEAHPETLFALIHFSLRHSDRQVLEFFDRECGPEAEKPLENLLIWATAESFLPEQHQSKS